ncbi:hypothetical protein [Arthrobacter sp. A5]|uniref:hypothetical protein n=1 Tax=Arthrobacter sp. A5 TaxID=576926 RepID=UPI003DA9EAED
MASRQNGKNTSGRKRLAKLALTAAQLGLQAAALADLKKRTSAQVNGPKAIWVACSFINFASPILYFVCGRRK